MRPTKVCQKCGDIFTPLDIVSDKLCKHCRYLKKIKQDLIKKKNIKS